MNLLDSAIAAHAAARPDAPAFAYENDGISYGELEKRVEALAGQLADLGVARGDRVGVYMDKCLEMPIAVFGILRAGAAYVPLDPAAPAARTIHVLKDCDCKVTITAGNRLGQLAALVGDTHVIDVIADQDVDAADFTVHPYATSGKAPATARDEGDLAYIIFSSGSTGVPKGICHTHKSAMAYATMARDLYAIDSDDRLAGVSPLHFDMSTLDMFAATVAGASTILIHDMYTRVPASLAQLLAKRRISILYTVPFMLISLLERGGVDRLDLSALRWIIFAGEPMSSKCLTGWQTLCPKASFANTYGPAEVNAITNFMVDDHWPEDKPIPVGYPCEGVDLQLDPDSGELLAAAPTMMDKYWNQPAMTSAAITQIDGKRYYRTGDIIVQDKDGLCHFRGRADRQIKLRGYRIELDEIEHLLKADPCVSEAAAIKGADGLTIDAFVSATPGSTPDPNNLSDLLGKTLPPYALPHRIVVLDSFARNSSGKIDRLALRKFSNDSS